MFAMGKRYELEYKEYVCRMVVEENRKVSELSHELNISDSALYRWVREYKQKNGWYEEQEQSKEKQKLKEGKSYKTPTDYKAEVKERDKEIERLTEENAILKKAMHVFTQARD